jgi:hypothetical protein
MTAQRDTALSKLLTTRAVAENAACALHTAGTMIERGEKLAVVLDYLFTRWGKARDFLTAAPAEPPAPEAPKMVSCERSGCNGTASDGQPCGHKGVHAHNSGCDQGCTNVLPFGSRCVEVKA